MADREEYALWLKVLTTLNEAQARWYVAQKAIEWKLIDPAKVKIAKTQLECVDGAEALLLATEWKEFRNPDFELIVATLRQPLVFDGRNMYEPALIRSFGIEYVGVGRGAHSGATRSGGELQ